MEDPKAKRIAQLFGGLSHPTRLRIVRLLTDAPMNVSALSQRLAIGQPSVSQHLAVLEKLGLVKAERSGTSRIYDLRGPRVAALVQTLDEFCVVHGLSPYQGHEVSDNF